MAEEKGYRDLKKLIRTGSQIKTGDKVYAICMNKSISLFNIGKKPLEEGMNILGAHIDSPRMDVKQNPLYESDEFAYLDTHYYGGIKKYQWVTLPLAIHGVVAKTNGETVDVCIGEKDDEPVFAVTDLLIHLAGRQMEKKASIVIEGEKLDLLIGSRPLSENPDDDEENKETRDAVKKNILRLLEEYCGMTEEDFVSAELEIVPAGRARDMGLDRSMVMGYGQDDRVCSFTSLFAMLDMDSVDKTSCCILVDKEEIGSVGATGMHSRFFENTVAEILALMGETFFAKGLVFNKFTGSRGKSGSNDANAEYLAALRKALDDEEVAYQFAELGKVDIGGGGTIAYIMANYGMEVIDSGVAVLCMHAPWEITSKADIYEAYKGYKAFLKNM